MRNKSLRHVLQVLALICAWGALPAAHALNITLSVPDCANGGTLAFDSNSNTLSCSSGTVTPPANTPGSCTVTASPTSQQGNGLTAGTLVTLTAACSSGLTPVTFSWNIGVVGPSIQVAPAQTTTYSVTTSNSAGAGQSASSTVYIGNSTPTVTAPGSCA